MAKHNLYKQAPVYAPNAVPSPAGWRDHRTNELLVAIKLNMTDFDGASYSVVEEVVAVVQQPEVAQEVTSTEPEAEVTEEVQPEVAEQTEEVTETAPEVVQQPAKQSKTKASAK
jgi:hypothetical protein